MYDLLRLIGGKFYLYTGILVAVFSALIALRKSGQHAEHDKNLKKSIIAMEKSHEIENQINALPDGDAINKLHKSWSRD